MYIKGKSVIKEVLKGKHFVFPCVFEKLIVNSVFRNILNKLFIA